PGRWIRTLTFILSLTGERKYKRRAKEKSRGRSDAGGIGEKSAGCVFFSHGRERETRCAYLAIHDAPSPPRQNAPPVATGAHRAGDSFLILPTGRLISRDAP